VAQLDGIWERNHFTNNGPLVNELELRLKNYLGLNHLLFLGNGTIALQIAIKALNLSGEVITTPFSYVATTSSLVWEGCKPVFVDIDEDSLNIDPLKIESAITDKTTGILATHVYGNPCDISKIQEIANKYKLKVVYDAAHCFGTRYDGDSVLGYGDISTISFHATKVFHSIEGGAVMTKHPDLLRQMSFLRNFGHDGPESFCGVGVNGKNSEFHAAMGLCNLRHITDILEVRKSQSRMYDHYLEGVDARPIKISERATFNYAYYPLVFSSESLLLKVLANLNAHEIFPRRYFYPSLNTLDYVDAFSVPISESISKRVLCLPLYHTLHESEIMLISRIIKRVQNNG
jgi:dTDP-4-amino-4,6-dideoxygalactose transaminase